MPLNKGQPIQNFIQSREVGAEGIQPPAPTANLVNRSITPQPQNPKERSRQPLSLGGKHVRSNSHNGAGDGDLLQGRSAESLKLEVPNTMRKTVSGIPQSAVVPEAGRRATAGAVKTQPLKAIKPNISAFDDTQSIHLDDSASLVDDDTRMTIQFGQDETSHYYHDPVKTASRDDFRQSIADGNSAFRGARRPMTFLGKDWRAQVNKEKLIQRQLGRVGAHPDQGETHSDYQDRSYAVGFEDDVKVLEEDIPPWNDTPSRPRLGNDVRFSPGLQADILDPEAQDAMPDNPASPPLPALKRAARPSVGDLAPQHINRFKLHTQDPETTDPCIDSSRSKHRPHPINALLKPHAHPPNPSFSSKVSSYHESSSEEDIGPETYHQPELTDTKADNSNEPSTPTTMKRSRSDTALDFASEALASKTFNDLDTIPFLLDPTLPPPGGPPISSTGAPIPLSTRLTNLSQMSPSAQATLFRTQTDEERSETLAWFLATFRTASDGLQQARLERRKVALRYELRIKMRARAVDAEKKRVERELGALRKGGGELIAGRTGN